MSLKDKLLKADNDNKAALAEINISLQNKGSEAAGTIKGVPAKIDAIPSGGGDNRLKDFIESRVLLSYLFWGDEVKNIDFNNLGFSTKNIKHFNNLFAYASQLENIYNFDISGITVDASSGGSTFQNLCQTASNLKSINFKGEPASDISLNGTYMFASCTSLRTSNITGLSNKVKFKNCQSMFHNQAKSTGEGPIIDDSFFNDHYDGQNSTSLSNMFSYASIEAPVHVNNTNTGGVSGDPFQNAFIRNGGSVGLKLIGYSSASLSTFNNISTYSDNNHQVNFDLDLSECSKVTTLSPFYVSSKISFGNYNFDLKLNYVKNIGNSSYGLFERVQAADIYVDFNDTTYNVTDLKKLFSGRTRLMEVKGLDLSGLTTAPGVAASTSNPFYNCTSLENLEITTQTLDYSLNLRYCTSLTPEGVDNIINGLKYTTKANTITFAQNVYDNLTETQKSNIQTRGWSIAYV